MKKRPPLRVGDVCKFSKRAKCADKGTTFVVLDIPTCIGTIPDTSDGKTKIKVCQINKGCFGITKSNMMMKRKDLWYTGHNAHDPGHVPIPTGIMGIHNEKEAELAKALIEQIRNLDRGVKNNDGRSHCLKCGEPTVFVQGAGANGYHMCKNKSCSWYDN